MLDFFFAQHHLVNIDLNELALKTESFVVQDIVDFVDKAIFESYKEGDYNNYIIILSFITHSRYTEEIK